MIRQANILEIPDILKLTKACTEDMVNKGIHQWNQYYPSFKEFENDVFRKELYVMEEQEEIIGIMALTPIIDNEYLDIKWLTPNHDNLYIHRLAIIPKYQGKGKAQLMMNFAEGYARDNKYISIRLDTFSKNFRNQKFYEKRGYKKLGVVNFPNQSVHPFFCYELII